MISAKIRKQRFLKKNISLILLEVGLALCVLAGAFFVASASLQAINSETPSLTEQQLDNSTTLENKKAS